MRLQENYQITPFPGIVLQSRQGGGGRYQGGRTKGEGQRTKAGKANFVLRPSESSSSFIERARAVDSRLHDLIAESCGNCQLRRNSGAKQAPGRPRRLPA